MGCGGKGKGGCDVSVVRDVCVWWGGREGKGGT